MVIMMMTTITMSMKKNTNEQHTAGPYNGYNTELECIEVDIVLCYIFFFCTTFVREYVQ